MAARKGKPKNFFEPWIATRSKYWEVAYQFGPPKIADPDNWEQAQAVLDWEASKFRAEQSADVIVWGSRMADPSVCANLGGSVVVMDDRRIIGIAKSMTWPDKGVTHVEVGERIVACINACAGIADPESFIRDVRALVLSYCRGECEDPRSDNRVVSILARCIPPEEREEFDEPSFTD